MVGLGVGDALGMPFEKLGEEIHPLLSTWNGKFHEGTFHKLPPGHYTDDTEMALCLAQVLDNFIDSGRDSSSNPYNPEEAAALYLKWSQGTPHGMGGSTKNAMKRLEAGTHTWRDSGQFFMDPDSVGSGTAMRVAPMGLFFSKYTVLMEQNIKWDAGITHTGTEAFVAALAVGFAVKFASDGYSGTKLFDAVIDHLSTGHCYTTKVFERLCHARTLMRYREAPSTATTLVLGRRGNAWQIVSTAIYCAAYHSNPDHGSYPLYTPGGLPKDGFENGVRAAIHLGGDTDTRGAITGAILGALYGIDGIPSYYKEGLKDFEMLHRLDERLWENRPETLVPCGSCQVRKMKTGVDFELH